MKRSATRGALLFVGEGGSGQDHPPNEGAPEVDCTGAVLNNLLHLSENRLVPRSLPH